ncbi:uncharacterized protein LOC125231282 [Leguminivora glycinivorella]|uniref:uncharacterized protein LOC125231282 n=1 Tax=Leguminivora glycinivorella TaxID=1035111 RepID=UPI00200F56CC|nr:uncharacterized protein LOC125231282 [Leguminivora glycinivorella]
MCSSRKLFKDKLKWCQDNQTQIKMDILATHHQAKNFAKFWKSTNKLNPKTGVPAAVDGHCEPVDIANLFRASFKTVKQVPEPVCQVFSTDDRHARREVQVRFSLKEVNHVIKSMTRGKSPGHDGLSIEHLYIKTQDAQFGFKPGLSTESAILCFKHTVKYYVDEKTPVIACFLDLSKAFDTVSYDILWNKMENNTSTPREVIDLFRYWYGHQTNQVRWAGAHSDVYRLDCGVRQGGLSSPRLFNLYMDELIAGLSSTNIGCSVGGTTVNNISYADDMVLLCPSVSALVKLLEICEEYAVAHGLRYNTSKSELLVFKAGNKAFDELPPVSLCGTALKRVTRFKYLGHWVTDTLQDDTDIERERRALAGILYHTRGRLRSGARRAWRPTHGDNVSTARGRRSGGIARRRGRGPPTADRRPATARSPQRADKASYTSFTSAATQPKKS